jgi:hypothetical protein
MNHWLTIALTAYFIGAVIEGVNAASQLTRSVADLDAETENAETENEEPPSSTAEPSGEWQVFAVIAGVSLCGAFLWPCRLIHRSIKGDRTI